MSEPFVGEVQLFAFSYAPYQWALAAGQTLPITQNTALFSLLGTYYGGNGSTTFQLPNLVNRQAASQGSGPGLTPRTIGQSFGVASVTLATTEMPNHTHSFTTYAATTGVTPQPTAGAGLAQGGVRVFLNTPTANTSLAPPAIQPSGGSLPHSNISPILAMNWSIALYGNFPSFN